MLIEITWRGWRGVSLQWKPGTIVALLFRGYTRGREAATLAAHVRASAAARKGHVTRRDNERMDAVPRMECTWQTIRGLATIQRDV